MVLPTRLSTNKRCANRHTLLYKKTPLVLRSSMKAFEIRGVYILLALIKLFLAFRNKVAQLFYAVTQYRIQTCIFAIHDKQLVTKVK